MEEKKLQDEYEINLLDYLIVIAKRKRFILKMTFCITLLVGIIVFIMPNKYEVTASFLPPQDTSSSMATAMLNQFGGLAAAAGSALGIKSPGAMYVGLVTSRTVQDKIIDRFGLMERYKSWKNWAFPFSRVECRKKLTEDIMSATADDESGIVSVTILEEDPKIATDMANAFIEELKELCKGLAVTDAARRRLFYEGQLKNTKENLVKAEEAMSGFQEKTGVLQVDIQAQAIIQGDAALRAQIAAQEVQIKVMKTFSTAQNPDLQKLVASLKEMKAQLAKLETKGASGNDPLMPTGRMPSVGLEYMRKLRDVKFNEVLYENLFKMYEIAKIDEVRDAAVIQVVDKGIVPDKKTKPKRVLIIIVAAFVGFLISVFSALLLEFKDEAGNCEKMDLLLKYARWRKDR